MFALSVFRMPHNGKAFVQGGISSTIVSTRTTPNKKHKSSF
jgi:hypothetical protein